MSDRPRLHALFGEYHDVTTVLEAARTLRREGLRRIDIHSPFPIHGVEKAIGVRPTILPWIVLGAGLTGALTGFLLAWWTNAVDYPFLISGKPIFSLPANIPVIFETTVLFSAFAAVFGMIFLNGLPRLHNPLLRHGSFLRATDDRFFLVIEARDPRFDPAAATRLLHETGALAVEEVRYR